MSHNVQFGRIVVRTDLLWSRILHRGNIQYYVYSIYIISQNSPNLSPILSNLSPNILSLSPSLPNVSHNSPSQIPNLADLSLNFANLWGGVKKLLIEL